MRRRLGWPASGAVRSEPTQVASLCSFHDTR